MAKQKSVEARLTLIEQLKLQMGSISAAIEGQGQSVFGTSNLMSDDEITDFSMEFLELMVMLLDTPNPLDDKQPAFAALRSFFRNMSRQILVRG